MAAIDHGSPPDAAEVCWAAEMTGSKFSSGTGGTATDLSAAPIPFDLLAQHAPCPWALIDTAGEYRYVSPAFVDVFGYTLGDLTDGQGLVRARLSRCGGTRESTRSMVRGQRRRPLGATTPLSRPVP